MSLLELRKAYLPIRVNKALWPYQTVMLKGCRYCLTWLGLNVAPLVMRSIIDSVMSQNRAIKNTTSTYIDDIYFNESLVPAACVRKYPSDYRLAIKDPEKLEDGTKVLGLQVWRENGVL